MRFGVLSYKPRCLSPSLPHGRVVIGGVAVVVVVVVVVAVVVAAAVALVVTVVVAVAVAGPQDEQQ